MYSLIDFKTELDTICSMSKEWKERIEKVVIGLILATAGIMLTAIIKGDQLKGLSKISAFFHILNAGVPLWLFLAVVIVAALASVRWFKAQQKQLIHVEWKNEVCLWCVATSGSEQWMQLNLHGFITNSGKDDALIITSVYLEGTKPAMSLHETIELPPEHVCDENIFAFVEPLLIEEGETFKGNVVFVDQFQRRHKAYIELKGHKPQPKPQTPPETAKSGA
jgi:hypothetical protein